MIRLFAKFLLILFGIESLRVLDRGDWHGAVFFALAVSLWFWRPILDFFLEERWRDDFRDW